MQILFAFTWNTETKAANWTGHISPEQALGLLQEIVVAEKVRSATGGKEKISPEKAEDDHARIH
ncbi:MAG: hypothetical protein A2158_01690 [Chloroflexi bacterium RBG_13_46_14]|nr:MAG: hypothetical protein A2158_01690 [Chloroflexi bacterium RBG_13_46_14]